MGNDYLARLVSYQEDDKQASRLIVPKFPKSQHKPVVIDMGISFPRTKCSSGIYVRHGEMNYAKYMEESTNCIPFTLENYLRFIKSTKKAATLDIQKVHKQNYTSC